MSFIDIGLPLNAKKFLKSSLNFTFVTFPWFISSLKTVDSRPLRISSSLIEDWYDLLIFNSLVVNYVYFPEINVDEYFLFKVPKIVASNICIIWDEWGGINIISIFPTSIKKLLISSLVWAEQLSAIMAHFAFDFNCSLLDLA